MYDAWGQPNGAAEFRVSGAWPVDGAGQFVEATVESCSQPHYMPVLQGLFGMGSSVLHLCAQAVGTCHLATSGPTAE
eukprot:2023116-Pyramimonas_sp.AAC.1